MLALAVLFAIGIAEVALRLIPSGRATGYRTIVGGPMFEPDSLLGWRPVANGSWRISAAEYEIDVESNELGLRAPALGSVRDEDCVALVLGDSFVQGLTVSLEEHFATLAERRIRELTDHDCLVIPAGVEGFATEQQLRFFTGDLRDLPLDAVVHFFYFNDVVCNHPDRACREDLARREPATTQTPAPRIPAADSLGSEDASRFPFLGLRTWLMDHSRVYHLTRDAMVRPRRTRTRPDVPFRSSFLIRPPPPMLLVFRVESDRETAEAWERTETLLAALAESAESRGARFSIFHVPARETIDADQWDAVRRFHGWTASVWSPDRARERLEEACERRELRCYSPADTFRSVGAGGAELYLLNDPHWSREGHRLVGELLADHLIDLLELDRATR